MPGSSLRGVALIVVVCAAGCRRPGPVTDAGTTRPSTPEADAGARPSPPAPDAGAVVTVRERTIRARVTITVAAPESPKLDQAFEAAFAEIEKLDDVMSDWRDTSELSKLNRGAGQGPMAVSPELFEMLQTARRISEDSGGAFDVTFASLGGLWSFRAEAPRMPTPDELAQKLPLVGYRKLVLDAGTAAITTPGTRVGLGALGDGYAAHRASNALLARGFGDHLVLIGGDGVARGARTDRPWRVGIRDPQTGGIWGTLELHDEGVATSGNYQKFFMKDGVRYHHLIDPKTGMPSRGASSVTVLARDGVLADGYATAMFVLGPVKGLPIAQKLGIEALWFDEAFVVSGTPGILSRAQKLP
jgi:thiamine biosynthesis lipoprotein